MKWYQDDSGNISSLRIIVIPAAWAGILAVAAGAVAVFMEKPAAGTMLSVGAGMVATAQGAKAWQKHIERR